MKKTILLLSIFLLTGVSKSIGQNIYDDVFFLKTINSCWRVSNSFEKFCKSCDSKSENVVIDRKNEISYVKKLLPCLKGDFEKLKAQFPNEDATKTLEGFIASTERVIKDLSDSDWRTNPPTWKVVVYLQQMGLEDLMAKYDCN